MRKLALLVAGCLAVAGPPTTGASPVRLDAGAGISLRLPHGWRPIRGWLSEVVDPIPRLAIASFPARLSRHSCQCGMPHIRDFPSQGAFLFVWEYPRYPPGALRRVPARPTRFLISQDRPYRSSCAGPSWEATFRAFGRVFDVQVYLGPAAGSGARAQMDAVLESISVARRHASGRVGSDVSPSWASPSLDTDYR